MREILNINKDWEFKKQDGNDHVEAVHVPHTWNAVDGTDGGNDYWRGTAVYTKTFAKPALAEDEQLWLEINGANSTSKVVFNGQPLAEHKGGYSTYRVDLTPALAENNTLEIIVDNAPNSEVYPQQADFTFYGGLYRDVNLIRVNKAHFALGYYGGCGVALTPEVLADGKGQVKVEAYTENAKNGDVVSVQIQNAEGEMVAQGEGVIEDNHASFVIAMENIHLWDGVEDPYLYTANVQLAQDGRAIDAQSIRIGFRTFEIDPEKGFILNGRPYQLIGTARHQDWEGIGNALTRENHEIDMALLKEMGARTIRGAHYQHDQAWYDLADENGLIMWAEIPYISTHMANEAANENTQEQMREIIIQNYNHPSIFVWGLSNEITIGGESEDLLENHRKLNDLAHTLDPTRKTVMAHVSMLPTTSPLVTLPDATSYNQYFGWYVGKIEDNDKWFDDFHAQYPNVAIGISEFGADANPQYHAEKPGRGDYTEDYQALYHEHMLKMVTDRPWIWAMHVWNGFDFAADARDEGGVPGRNQKGLVTFDRKTKKDSYYIYQAYLSKTPFVHLTKKRYIDREQLVTEVKVYTNEPEATLYVDGQNMGTQKAVDHICRWNVEISKEHAIKVVGSDETINDTMTIRKVDEKNEDYIVKGGSVHNWFDDGVEKDGYLSIMDSIGDVMAVPEAMEVLRPVLEGLQNMLGKRDDEGEIPAMDMNTMMMAFPVETALRMSGALTKEEIIELNKTLNKIKK